VDRRARILVVDDNDLQREVVADLLSGEGHDVAVASSGAEALVALRARTPDVLVLDLMLPDMDGASVLEEARRDPALVGVRVLVTTAMQSAHVRRLVASDATLFKPFDLRELVTAVAQLAGSVSRRP
jgi:CheY-like chemotaxis protein